MEQASHAILLKDIKNTAKVCKRMLKKGILNPQLNFALSKLGHMDSVMVCDSGMPVPSNVDRVDLEFVAGMPEIMPVLQNLIQTIAIEKVYVAEEIKTASPELNEKYIKLFQGIAEIIYIKHDDLKKESEEAQLAIKTGEFCYHYSTVLLIAGCAY